MFHHLRILAALAGVLTAGSAAQAGLFDHFGGHASKCCDCAPTFQPECCRPKFVRPCCTNVYSYQRSCAKPMGCCDECAPSCCPVTVPCGDVCAPIACAAPCATPCAPATCGTPCDNSCAPASCDGCAPAGGCAASGGSSRLADLIYQSQTGCYPCERKRAIKLMGTCYDCKCHPEIMNALIYALNDADPWVRAAAADEIGDQLRMNPCCCSPAVLNALKYAAGDCSYAVVRQAEQGLRVCGYDVCRSVCNNGNACHVCGSDHCDGCCTGVSGVMPVTAPSQPVSEGFPKGAPIDPKFTPPSPAPPASEGDRAYFPQRGTQTKPHPSSLKDSLSYLFSIAG